MPKQNPWDRLKPVPTGDSTRTSIYTAVGMALDQWEAAQENLEILFCVLVESESLESYSYPLRRAFGTLESVPNKVGMMREAAAVSLGNNKILLEKTRALLTEIEQFSFRRNDIAHGQVNMYRRGPSGWFLTPGFHQTKKRALGSPDPVAYRWTADQINQYTTEFRRLQNDVRALFTEINVARQPQKSS